MNTIPSHVSLPIQDSWRHLQEKEFRMLRRSRPLSYSVLALLLFSLLALFLFAGTMLQRFDPAAGILDVGILTVLLFGLIGGVLAIVSSVWLQELLWQPFKVFRKQFQSHFNRLSSWQQCILYFSVFFLLLYAALWGLAMVL